MKKKQNKTKQKKQDNCSLILAFLAVALVQSLLLLSIPCLSKCMLKYTLTALVYLCMCHQIKSCNHTAFKCIFDFEFYAFEYDFKNNIKDYEPCSIHSHNICSTVI